MKRFFLNVSVIESPNADNLYDVFINGVLMENRMKADDCSALTIGELDEMYEFRMVRKDDQEGDDKNV